MCILLVWKKIEILIIDDQVISNKDDTNPMMVCISYLFVHMMITAINESENYDMYSLLFKTFIILNIAIQDIDLILPLQMFESSPLILRNRKLDCLHWNIFLDTHHCRWNIMMRSTFILTIIENFMNLVWYSLIHFNISSPTNHEWLNVPIFLMHLVDHQDII
jgi:hypothetical protein